MTPTASDWSRLVLLGVSDYLALHGPWDVFLESRGALEASRLPRGWRGDGFLVRLTGPALARTLRRSGRPAVNVSWLGAHEVRIPKVVSDESACGRLAAEHFLDRGFQSFGFVGPLEHLGYGPDLSGAFVRFLEEAGRDCRVFSPGKRARQANLFEERQRLRNWLARLPTPVGVVAWNSEGGREVVALARALGRRVPEDVAVLCVEHDDLMSALSPVPLSSIDQDPRRVGFEAAALLARLMDGEAPPEQPILVPPVGVLQRRSSETFAIEDEVLGESLRIIRERSAEPIGVLDVARQLSLSRRALEQRFRRGLGRTPAAEIRRVRLDRVKRLLLESDLSLADIAERTGFRHPEVMMRSFRRTEGVPPGEWRRRRRR